MPRTNIQKELDDMVADQRYWDSSHPEHRVWVEMVTNGYGLIYPGEGRYDYTGRMKENPYPAGSSDIYDENVMKEDVKGYGVNDVMSDDEYIEIPTAPNGIDVDANIAEAEQNWWNPVWFYEKVRNGGPWDFKKNGREYEDYGNFHYGVMGAAMGYSEDTLMRMAGWAQVRAKTSDPSFGENDGSIPSYLGFGGTPPFGDDPNDQLWIARGIRYYNRKRRK